MECLKLLTIDTIQTAEKLVEVLSHFIDPPRENYIKVAVDILTDLGALNRDGVLTSYGKILNKMPATDIFIANTLIFGKIYNCSREVMKISTLIDITRGNLSDLYNLPGQNKEELEKKFKKSRKKFEHKYGDHLTMLNIYEEFEEQLKKNDRNKLYEWCYINFFKPNTLLKAPDNYKKMKGQLYQIEKIDHEAMGLKYFEEINNLEISEKVLTCFIMGFQLNTAVKQGNIYHTLFYDRDKIKISKISTLVEKKPKNVIYYELFVSMGQMNLSIVSEIPNKIMNILK